MDGAEKADLSAADDARGRLAAGAGPVARRTERTQLVAPTVAAAVAPLKVKPEKGVFAMAALALRKGSKKAADDLEVPPPEDGEDEEEFMDRCQTEVQDENPDADPDEIEQACQIAWDSEARTGAHGLVRKATFTEDQGDDFILSDATPDRFGDTIQSDGWVLSNFKRNPIALFGHDSSFVIGVWKNVRVERAALRGNLVMAPEGSSARIDELRRLRGAGILKAASVGFRPIETEQLDPDKFSINFIRQELVECSLVAVPANPNCLAVAKSLGISEQTQRMIFGKHAGKDLRRTLIIRAAKTGERANQPRILRRTKTGEYAESNPQHRGETKMPVLLSKRIEDQQARIVTLQDTLNAHLASIDDANPDEGQMAITEDLTQKLALAKRQLAVFQAAEAQQAQTAGATVGGGGTGSNDTGGSELARALAAVSSPGRALTTGADADGARALANLEMSNVRSGLPAVASPSIVPRPFQLGRKKLTPMDILIRSGVVTCYSHILRKNPEDVLAMIPQYRDDPLTKAFVGFWSKAATAPALTTVTGWAAELVTQINADFMQTLMPKAVFPSLSALGIALNFGRAGRIAVPTRSRTPTIAGSFVGEGAPIPVRQGQFTAQVLTPKKMAVISCWSREIDEHSIPAMEGLLRQAISEDTAVSLDSVLIDTNAATLVRPAGLLNGIAGLTATGGGGFTALVGDIKQLSGAVLTATAGNVREPVWLMNPQQTLSAGLTSAPGTGVMPFRDEISRGRFANGALIESGTVPLGTVIHLDAQDFVVVGGEAPRFEVSDQATLHMEDTTPLPIGSAGTPPVVAAPVTSLWQTDSLALRLILPVNWALRRTGVVSWTSSVTW
jgi:HK97 family phage prohead protease